MRRIGSALILTALLAGFAPASAQVTPIIPGNDRSDFNPLLVKPEDLADGKRLAETTCVGCHGENGISTTENVPHIAGQRSVYLYVELKAYRTGLRKDTIMTNIVKFLNDDALVRAAAYYATLDPAQPSDKPASVNADPLESGKAAAESCGGCHGATGVSGTAGIPSLVGLDPKYLVAAMQEYKSGRRENATMKAMLAAVPDDKFADIALFYALQKADRAQTKPEGGNAEAGKAATASCAGCHGDTGVSGSATNPSLAGQDAQYLVGALAAYKEGTRDDETMKGMVGELDDEARKNIAAFFAAQQPAAPNVRKPLSAGEWAERCNRCHGVNGNSVDPHIPALAGQREDYLVQALQNYRSRSRRNNEMGAMADALNENDIKALAAFYSRQRPRAAVYVVIPDQAANR
jgi:cytochrome c553